MAIYLCALGRTCACARPYGNAAKIRHLLGNEGVRLPNRLGWHIRTREIVEYERDGPGRDEFLDTGCSEWMEVDARHRYRFVGTHPYLGARDLLCKWQQTYHSGGAKTKGRGGALGQAAELLVDGILREVDPWKGAGADVGKEEERSAPYSQIVEYRRLFNIRRATGCELREVHLYALHLHGGMPKREASERSERFSQDKE